MSTEIVKHPDNPDFWRHEPPKPRPCASCGIVTKWVYLDIAYFHLACEKTHQPNTTNDTQITIEPECPTCGGAHTPYCKV